MTWDDFFADLELRKSRGLEVVPYPHPAIRHKCVPVHEFGPGLQKLVKVMFEVMYDRKGCGLAAPQLGLPLRVFVINPTGDPKNADKEKVFVNPVVAPKTQRGRTRTYREVEGCLSISGLNRQVDRPHDIEFAAFDAAGKPFKGVYGGLTARVVLHENDHLDGVLFIDALDDTQKPGVPQWLSYLCTQFEWLQDKIHHFPPIADLKAQLVALEALAGKQQEEDVKNDPGQATPTEQEAVVPPATCPA